MESNPILKKQLAIKYAGNIQEYEHFKRIMGASPALYPHDYLFYNDDVTARHSRNIKEIAFLKSLLREDKLESSMLSFNVFNTFYPTYVLHHHFDIFLPVISQFSAVKEVKEILVRAQKYQVTGAFFNEKVRLDFKRTDSELPVLNDAGAVQMNPQTYFYSGVTSPYATHSAFLAQLKGGLRLVVIQLKNKDGAFAQGINVRDMGATVSNDYLSIGYNFSGIKPLITIELTPQLGKKLSTFNLKHRFNEFSFSLKDLQKSLWVTINYTKMRRQFKTNDTNKEERRIITYQAVATRIINGFAQFIALSDLYSRAVEQGRSYIILTEILQSAHHNILEDLVHLRECCGGFGYMQVSGHPGCIERVCFRAGNESKSKLKLTPEYLQATQYYASSQESEKYYCQPFSVEKPSYMNFFGVFLSIIFNMRRNQGTLSDLQFRREYLKQSSLMAMHAREEFTRHDATNIHCLLLQYAIASYIIKQSKFINWQLIKVEPAPFFERLEEFRTNLLLSISKDLESLGETLELTYLRNIIVGKEEADDYYKEVTKISKANLRNQKEYLDYVQAPIVEMITNSRGKL